MSHYCDALEDEPYTCLYDSSVCRVVHGLGCYLWSPPPCQVNPFIELEKLNPIPVKEKKPKARREPMPPGAIALPEGCESVYELTLTTTKDDPYELRQALAKVVASRMFEVIKFIACMELQDNGNPHIHACLYSKKKYLDATKIKGKPVNFPYRYQLKKVHSHDQYLNYIKKEDGTDNIKQYCELKGIPQFWDSDAIQ